MLLARINEGLPGTVGETLHNLLSRNRRLLCRKFRGNGRANNQRQSLRPVEAICRPCQYIHKLCFCTYY